MIAVFCLKQRHFDELNLTPREMFKRIRNVNNIYTSWKEKYLIPKSF